MPEKEAPVEAQRRNHQPAAAPKDEIPIRPITYFALLIAIFGLAAWLSIYRLWLVPPSLSETASLQKFSEGRALQHVKALTDLGPRVAGQPEIQLAAEYLVFQSQKLVQLAKNSRPDLLVQVSHEEVSGTVETSFLNYDYINLYSNLTNVILAISPTAGLRERSVLVNAHFDSTLGTAGASDDASNVGVILEMARTIIANPEIKLAAPIVFLMNGGEEALCPAAHGFMQQSRWARDVGVFLNLESTGPLGPDFVFQHTGIWPIQAFAAVAPFPRGSVIAQDFFELGLVPADTDYRMFSAKGQGSLPGLDTAFLLGAGMYHTDRDSLKNIRPGTLQAMGQNAVAVVEELGKQLALRNHRGEDKVDTGKAIFFDVLGMFMVVYPFSWAKVVHSVPLIVTLSLPFVHDSAFGHMSLTSVYLGMAFETMVALLSCASAIVVSALVGIFRVTSLGAPMAWYGNDVMPYAILVPAAIAGLLLPYLGRRVDPKLAALGTTAAFSLLSAGLTAAGLGASFVPVVWALAGLFTMTDLEVPAGKLLQRATISCIWPVIMMMPNAIALSSYILQKSSFTGAQGQPDFTLFIADGVAGAVVGLSTLSTVGFLTPWIAFASGKSLRRAVLMLLCISTFFAVQTSLVSSPYTYLAPKKVPIQHLHEYDSSGTLLRSVFAIGAVDSVPVDNLLDDKHPQLWAAEKSGWEWLTLYPLGDKYVKGVVLQAPPPDSQTKPPRLELLSRTTATDTGVDKLLFQLHLPKPGLVGCMRFHGEMLEWSLPPLKAFNGSLGNAHERYVRFVGAGPLEHHRFWVEVNLGSKLEVWLTAADPRGSLEVEKFTEGWPAWTFVINLRTVASSWTF